MGAHASGVRRDNNVSVPVDQAARDEFANELDTNFSVIASAGSGKTQAITQRVVQIARSNRATELLPKLVVVTYTNRAADEMQQRARERIFESRDSFETRVAFERAFFGTIHSFCVNLIARHGHFLGLPPTLDLLADDEEIWSDFVQRQQNVGASLGDRNRAALLRHVQLRRLMELARGQDIAAAAEDPGEYPQIDLRRVLIFPARANATAIADAKRAAQEWQDAMNADADFVPLPDCRSDAPEFCAEWHNAFAPLREWLSRAALQVAATLARVYREYRIERGVSTFDDQVALADELLQHPVAADRIRGENLRIILDEAQDTAPQQFSVLIEATRPRGATSRWIDTAEQGPRAGYFCMVGDLQQSIYTDKGALPRYQRVHEQLIATGAAKALKFDTTFRLDKAAIKLLNKTFRALLNNKNGQVEFVELHPRPAALPGQVLRVEFTPRRKPAPGEKVLQRLAAGEEAELLAQWLCTATLAKLRARSWRRVAVLCPRKDWLQTLHAAFGRRGLCAEIHSEKEINADSPAHSWLTALVTIMAQPFRGYEIVGVLRDIFGVSDDALAAFSQGDGERFQIASPPIGNGEAAEQLRLLSEIRTASCDKPLFRAVQQIVERTSLRARLRVLPPEDAGDVETELEALLNAAADVEAAGKTLDEFAELLRTNLGAKRELTPTAGDAIQLLTTHMAKGSEWDAVIVPYLSRGVSTASENYPRLIRTGEAGVPMVALDKQDVTVEVKATVTRAERQNLQRLLYVAFTRAKHSLVLIDDGALFASVRGSRGAKSQLERLRADADGTNSETFSETFSDLGAEASECAMTAAVHDADAMRLRGYEVAAATPVSHANIETARRIADDFIRKQIPSDLAKRSTISDDLPEFALDADRGVAMRAAGDAAIQYGLAWHDFVQRLPLLGDDDVREQLYLRMSESSPDPARFAREWELLRAHLGSSESFVRRFTSRPPIVHTEFPIMWQMSERFCVEGLIDIAMFDGDRRWFILDWKTNRAEDVDALKRAYRPQIAAYWKALTIITQMTVEAALYSTVTGKLASYAPDELENGWREISR